MNNDSPYRAIRSDGIEMAYPTSEALRAAIRSGQVGPADLVRLSDRGPWVKAADAKWPSDSEGQHGLTGSDLLSEWVCGECGADIGEDDTLCPLCGADVADDDDEILSQPRTLRLRDYRGWWIAVGVVSFIFGWFAYFTLSEALGFVLGAFLVPGLLTAFVALGWRLLRRPLDSAQIVATFVAAWLLLMILQAVGRTVQ